MTYEEAKTKCAVRSAIYRRSNRSVKYWKNHSIPLDERVPEKDQLLGKDWEEYDPREDDSGSLFMMND